MIPARRAAALLLLATTLSARTESRAVRADAPGVELVRDRWGVPHVFAGSDEGAMYGLGYAAAADRAFQMYYGLRIMQGRAAESLGNVTKLGGRETALDHDRKFRTIGYYRAAQALSRRLDAPTRGLLQAYSDGVNEYVRRHRDRLLYLFKSLALEPEPWTPADCIASWWHVGLFFSGDGLGDAAARRPRGGRGPVVVDDRAAVIQRGDVSDAWVERAGDFARRYAAEKQPPAGPPGPRFSHAWVVGGRRTTTGSAVLVSDPQTPVRYPNLLYEFHVSGASFNARGVGVAGSPVLLIGFNERVAWGMTALGADQADQFVLKVASDRPDQYLFDGAWRRMSPRTETLRVRGGPTENLAVRETHLGPVVTRFSRGLEAGEEVALKRIPLVDLERDTIQAAFAMMRARNAGDFTRALEGWRFPSANVVFGDAQGAVGYRVAGAFPLRSRLAPDGGIAAHEGSDVAHDWQGFVPDDLVPHLIDPARALLFSANHRPIASFYTIPLGISTGSTGDTVRSWRLRELLGRAGPFRPEEVFEVHRDRVNPARRDLVRLGLHARDTLGREPSSDAARALMRLEPWFRQGARSDLSREGTELAELIPTGFRVGGTSLAERYGGGDPGLAFFLKTATARVASDPRAALPEDEARFVDESLAAAWRQAVRLYGPDPGGWHRAALRLRDERRLGYFVGLDGFPSLDAARDLPLPPLTCLDVSTILSQAGQSYTQWVALADVDGAQALLPVGASEHPEDPGRSANLRAWASGELRPAPLTRKGVGRYAAGTERLR